MKQTTLSGRNFKKKPSSTVAEPLKPTTQQFNELKSKITQQKSMMNKSGRRFRQQTQQSVKRITHQEVINDMKKKEVSIGSSPPKKTVTQTCTMTNSGIKLQMSLQDLGDAKSYESSSMSSSRVFEKQIEIQKNRGKDLTDFLITLELGGFHDQFMELGYDDLQTMVEIQTEDLNHMMMRAFQQNKLMAAIKTLRNRLGLEEPDQKPLITNPSAVVQKRIRPKSAITTNPSTPSQSRAIQKKKKQTAKFQLPSRSFLLTCGSNLWSVESQIRRACSTCFKVTQNIQKKGTCYYCQDCYKFVAEDPLSVSLSSSMLRQYHDL